MENEKHPFPPEQIAIFRRSARKQIQQKGSCLNIDCAECRGSVRYNEYDCVKNGRWSKTANPLAVKYCEKFLAETEPVAVPTTKPSPVCGTDAKERKECPIYSGFITYFPDAIAAVARLSFRGNEQHNPGTPLHWDRSKSGDEMDALMRHIVDGDWEEVAWRAMANLQKVIEARKEKAG